MRYTRPPGPPGPRRPPHHRRRWGFSLIELMVALTLFAVVVTVVLKSVAPMYANAVHDVHAGSDQVGATQIGEGIASDFSHLGTFAGFLQGDSGSFDAVFATSNGYDVPGVIAFDQKDVVTVPGLNASVGDWLMLVANGEAKVFQVTGRSGQVFQHTCTNGTGATGATIYKVVQFSVKGDAQGNVYRRFDDQSWQLAAKGGSVGFRYMYRTPQGGFVYDPTGAPNNVDASGNKLAYLRVSVLRGRGGQAQVLPVDPGSILRFLNCSDTPHAAGDITKNTLKVSVFGLPSGVSADAHLSGPTLDTAVTTTNTWPVPRGTFKVTANNVTVNGVVYTPMVRPSTVNITGSSQEAYASISYYPPGNSPSCYRNCPVAPPVTIDPGPKDDCTIHNNPTICNDTGGLVSGGGSGSSGGYWGVPVTGGGSGDGGSGGGSTGDPSGGGASGDPSSGGGSAGDPTGGSGGDGGSGGSTTPDPGSGGGDGGTGGGTGNLDPCGEGGC